MTYLADKKTLYLLTPGIKVRATPTQIRWTGEDGTAGAHPREGVRDIVLTYRAEIDATLMTFARDTEACISFVDGRFEPVGTFVPPLGGRGNLRYCQYGFLQDERKKGDTARAVIRAKVGNQFAIAREYLKDDAPKIPSIPDGVDMESLLGLEGAYARAYFARWSELLAKTAFGFDGRRKHPAPDPVNALYDFTISRLASDIFTFCHITGLDPYMGFYHTYVHYRPSLVADLVEEWRAPVVDKFILVALRRSEFSPDDFVMKDGACRFVPSAWGKAVAKWQTWFASKERDENTYRELSFRDLVELQVRHFARVCIGDDPAYIPYQHGKVANPFRLAP